MEARCQGTGDKEQPWGRQVPRSVILLLLTFSNCFSQVLSKKARDWEHVYPLYYGWFLHVTDTQLLVDTARALLDTCLDIEEMFSDLSNSSGYLNKQGIIDHYSKTDHKVHCTSR